MGSALTGRHDHRPLALALDDVGCSLLVLQSSAARRTQFMKFDTCVNDIRSGVNWAKALNFEEIVLIGVSMGSARVSYWNAVAPDPAVKAMVLIATLDSVYLGGVRWTREERERQDAIMQSCRELIADGLGEQLIIGELESQPFPMTAEAYLSYFGQLQEMNASSLKYAHAIEVPIIMIHGTEDVVCPPQGAQAVYDALSAAPHKELLWVRGGAHQLMMPGSSSVNVVSAKIAEFVAKGLDPR
jgi:pimeloyl-ACP methyl ester carboxylesterase